ncbi:YceI family protein [Neptunomonas antarctica]|uniref:Polyisoprenoid-binding protein YceI n=1 Tax=Neptunomonas antarctica TaxID=619304 RepID=A0A1N7MVX6_9GAMM|nr:YceI family protein [Neptunomonas antarctica]SIS90246.1 Polyisoprenoid-binding protein YceI [Neptunomonas antarctica]
MINHYLKLSVPRTLLAITLGSLLSLTAQADWQLDNTQSSLNFISVKNINAAEVFHITQLQGSLSDSGALEIKLDLDSIKTQIDIRDERLREHLFDTAKFKMATLSTQLSAETLSVIKQGGVLNTSIEGMLDFHGLQQPIMADVTLLSDGTTVLASTTQPIIIKAADFGLGGGIEKLRELAGLSNIGHSVPVSFNLVLK